MDPERQYYFPITGYNFRLTNVACAMLCAQLERSEQIIERRRQIFSLYREMLTGIPGIGFQPFASVLRLP
jgi:perosamine synthetase